MRLAGTKLAANHQYRGFGDQLYDLSGQRPSLDLQFANQKSLVDATTGQNLVTFTRASSGTYVDSQGVIRTATTNLLLRSEEFDTASWTKVNTTVSLNAATAPDNTTTADKLITDNSIVSTSAHIRQIVSKAATATTYTLTVFAKTGDAGTGTLQLLASDATPTANSATSNFSTVSGTITVAASSQGTFTNASSTITPFANGWYRCSLTFTSGTETSIQIRLYSRLPTTGDGTSGIYIWGAQLEQSSTVGEYIPTTSTINSAPRFDHNPTTGESLGLLVEESRTNLLTRSEEFDAVTWTPSNAATPTANAVVAPDGTLTADKLITTNAVTGGQVFQTFTLLASTAYTFSVFAKASEWSWCKLTTRGPEGSDIGAWFNLSNGTVGTVESGVTASIQSLRDGWYRCIVARTTGNGAAAGRQRIYSTNGDNALSTGNGTSGIYIWGAQLEAGAFPTSYIPTTTAAVTRSADVASITGSNWSSWGSSTTGTYYLEAAVTRSSASAAKVFLGASTSPAESYYLYQVQNQSDLRTFDSTNVLDTVNTISDGVAFKSAAAYSSVTLTRSLVLDGGTVTEGAFDGTYGTDLSIGSRIAGGAPTTGTIRRLTYWPQRLPDSTLQGITQ